MGYAPLFDTLTKGTLCGKWPDIGLWPVVLSMSDRHGIIDATPAYISGVTGLPVGDVEACMDRFCQPDPYSRSQEKGGARLELLDVSRPWGWRVINHGKYREKARLTAKAAHEVASGKNRDRMGERTRDDRRSPPETAADPLSKLQTPNSDFKPQSKSRSAEAPDDDPPKSKRGTRVPEPFVVAEDLRQWFAAKCPHVILEDATDEFVRYWKAVPGAKGCKLDWPATWQNRMVEMEARAVKYAPRPLGRDLTWRPE